MILALIRRALAGLNQVGCPLAVAVRRQRVGVHDCPAVGRQHSSRDDVVRERLAGRRIVDDPGAGEEAVVRVEQLAEVTVAHRRRRHRDAVGLHLEEVDPLLGAEEEQLVLEHRARNRAAEGVAVLLVVERRRAAVLDGVRAAVAPPAVGLQRVVAVEERGAAGVVAAAALGHEPDLPAARTAVLRHVVGGQDLHFLDGVDVLDADDVAGRPRADGGRAVDGDVVLVVAAAVDVVAAVAEIAEAARVEVAAAADARLQAGDADWVAALERQQLDVFRLDGLAHRDVGLQQWCIGRDGHHLGDGARFECEIHREGARRVELDVLPRSLLVALSSAVMLFVPGCRFANV